MKSRFESNDFIAILIAIALIAAGFALYFIHEQSTAKEAQAVIPAIETTSPERVTAAQEALVPVALESTYASLRLSRTSGLTRKEAC